MRLVDFLSEERGRQAALSKAIGAHAPDLSRWASGERPVPIERCAAIERATAGAVTRRDLRPHDWHLIWPELGGSANSSSGQVVTDTAPSGSQ